MSNSHTHPKMKDEFEMHNRIPCLNLLVVTWITLTVVAWPATGDSAEGTLTGCRIEAYLVDQYGPTFPNEASRAHVSARYTNPTASAECGMTTGPSWAWTIRSVERQNPMTMAWEPHTYRPNLGFPHRQRALVSAYFPVGGVWRVTLDVKAVWTSEACGSCEATSSLVIDFPDVSNCSFVGEVAFTDDFDGRSRTSVGLREEGTLSVRFAPGTVLADVAPLKWSQRSGGDFAKLEDSGDGNATFKATFETGQAVFELKSQVTGCVSTVTLDVLAPSGTKHKFSRFHPDNGVFNGLVDFHIFNNVYISPTNVSFRFIKFGEGEDKEADLSGEFKRAAVAANQPLAPHEEDGPYAVTTPVNAQEGSCWEFEDEIGPMTLNENGEAGHFVWKIPQQWYDAALDTHDYNVLTQRHDFDGRRTIRIQKGGVDKRGP